MGNLWAHTGAIECIVLTLYHLMTPYDVMVCPLVTVGIYMGGLILGVIH